jgi:hypothetical protein
LPIIELVLILFIFIAGASIVWSTLKVGISPMPSSHKARHAMFQLVEETEGGSIYDLGSGWGHLVIRLAKQYPKREIVAYELSLLPWCITLLFKKLLGLSNLTVHRENFLNADLSGASVLLCYLHSPTMTAIKKKLDREANEDLYLISHNFALPSESAIKVIPVDDFYKSPVYLYRLNHVKG